MSQPKKRVHIFILSDSTGTTAEMVINAVLVQFKDIKPVFKKFPYITRKEQIQTILNQAHTAEGIIIYSLVSPELRTFIRREQRAVDVYAIDLLGPILDRIRKQWDSIPLLKPGLLRGLSEESIRLAESIDFTLKHDDGQGMDTIGKADLIILGVSRTSKTPTSLYLSCNYGLKVVNVPIILGMRPPERIYRVKAVRIGFTIELERLAYIRRKRLKYTEARDYLEVTHIREELNYSHQLFDQIKDIQVLDVTHSSIEEVATRIVEIMEIGETAGARI